MKRFLSVLTVLLMLVMAFSANVFADSTKTPDTWGVTLTSSGNLESNFSAKEFNDAIYNMQPGDDVTITLRLRNNYDIAVDWYMLNEVVQSLEDASKTAGGGAYAYELVYKSPSSTEPEDLFRSDSVGGEGYVKKDLEGLKGATDNLKDYFYLDTIEPGKEGLITLKITLEGETQGNDYQDTLAELRMKFAVELDRPKNTTVVITGEETHPLPLIIIASTSGVLLLILGIVGLRLRKAAGKEAKE